MILPFNASLHRKVALNGGCWTHALVRPDLILAFIAMINEIPAEILQAIFELVVGKFGRDPPSDSEANVQDMLCSVCHLWRNVALQDPSVEYDSFLDN